MTDNQRGSQFTLNSDTEDDSRKLNNTIIPLKTTGNYGIVVRKNAGNQRVKKEAEKDTEI